MVDQQRRTRSPRQHQLLQRKNSPSIVASKSKMLYVATLLVVAIVLITQQRLSSLTKCARAKGGRQSTKRIHHHQNFPQHDAQFDLILDTSKTDDSSLSSTESSLSKQEQREPHYIGLAMTTAFNHRRDEFKGTGPVNASFDYISNWFESVQKYPNVKGAIIHNMFSRDQIQNWILTTATTKVQQKQIRFIPLHNTSKSFQRGQDRPINDMRFFTLSTALFNIAKPENRGKYPPYVLISDVHDVKFLRNPFEFMQGTDELIGTPQLYIGEESLWGSRKNVYDDYMNSSSVSCYNKPLLTTPARMVNCGLIGGKTEIVAKFISKIADRLDTATPHKVCDQISLWWTLKDYRKDKYISGYPFNTMFKKYETTTDTKAYIAHK